MMSGVTHTVHVTLIEDHGNTTQYFGHVTYPMSERVLFVAVHGVTSLDANEDQWMVVDENDEPVSGACEADIIRHIKNLPKAA